VLVDLDPAHPVLAMLSGAIAHFSERGISTLVYVNPINVEHLVAVGIRPSDALARSLQSIETTVEQAGGKFADLHALLPDVAFRDAAGHFGGDVVNGPALLAKTLAQILARSERSPPRTSLSMPGT
jgi:hypothetical protein